MEYIFQMFHTNHTICDLSCLAFFTMHKGNPLQYSCLENPMNGGSLVGYSLWVTKSQTRLSDFTLMFSKFIHIGWIRISFFFLGWIIFHCVGISYFVYPFICWRKFGWFLLWGCWELCCFGYTCTNIYFEPCCHFFGIYSWEKLLDLISSYFL